MDPADPPPYPRSTHNTVPSPHSYALSGKIMLSAIVILFSIVLLILFLHFYVRWHVLRQASRRSTLRRRRRLLISSSSSDLSPLPNPPAIDPTLLNSLPVLLFSQSDVLSECDCAVCLSEFEHGQKIRTLPRCGHTFHIDCIDMWFSSHSSCPLCRAPVEPAPSDFCSSCCRRDEVGASSSEAVDGELAIEVAERGGEGFGGGAEREGLGRALKWPMISRVVLLRRFLTLDIQANRVGRPDLEAGEGASPPEQ